MERTSLKSAFFRYVIITFAMIGLLSAGVILGCIKIQNWLLPKSEQVYLHMKETKEDGTEITTIHLMEIGEAPTFFSQMGIEVEGDDKKGKIEYWLEEYENTPSRLSPKRKLLYQATKGSMVLFPLLFSLGGILICGNSFYKRKIEKSVAILSQAAEQIMEQDLDFTIEPCGKDELGELCLSFEKMRVALLESNKSMWNLLEENRKLQASVAHDLRNPIAIIKGHAQYLQINVPLGEDESGKSFTDGWEYRAGGRTVRGIYQLHSENAKFRRIGSKKTKGCISIGIRGFAGGYEILGKR